MHLFHLDAAFVQFALRIGGKFLIVGSLYVKFHEVEHHVVAPGFRLAFSLGQLQTCKFELVYQVASGEERDGEAGRVTVVLVRYCAIGVGFRVYRTSETKVYSALGGQRRKKGCIGLHKPGLLRFNVPLLYFQVTVVFQCIADALPQVPTVGCR